MATAMPATTRMTTADYLGDFERSVNWEPLDVRIPIKRERAAEPLKLLPYRRQQSHYVKLPEDQARRDAYPEEADYRDDGCDLHPACLTCPLERCRYDYPRPFTTIARVGILEEQIVALQREGLTIAAIGRRLGSSKRSVLRRLAAIRARSAAQLAEAA